jgi:hypothetical protein
MNKLGFYYSSIGRHTILRGLWNAYLLQAQQVS